MHQSFFSSVSELLARVVALILVLLLFTVFFLAKADFRLGSLVGFGALISGGIILYELTAFVFFEIFTFVEQRAHAIHAESVRNDNIQANETLSNAEEVSKLESSQDESVNKIE